MSSSEVERVLRICTACMYCDGICPVFPALAGKHGFARREVDYLAHLCHNCRACWHVCQYAPPHPFAVNIPAALAEARRQSFADYVWPRWLASFVRRPDYVAWLLVVFALVGFVALGLSSRPLTDALAIQTGAGAFYAAMPWDVMAGLAGASALWAAFCLTMASVRYGRAIAPPAPPRPYLRVMAAWLGDVLSLRRLGGDGPGIDDAGTIFSWRRRVAHQIMACGVMLDFISTTAAAVYQEVLGLVPPFALDSLPVSLGIAGGLAIVVGACGLLALQLRADPGASERGEARLNLVFLALLVAVAGSGLALVGLRETTAMASLLRLHICLVVGGFVALPASKMLHAPFRAIALWRAAAEQKPVSGDSAKRIRQSA